MTIIIMIIIVSEQNEHKSCKEENEICEPIEH